MYVTASYITQLAVPEYILGVIQAKPGILALYGAGILAVVLLTVFFALVLPLFMLERKSFGSAVKESCRCVKQRFCEVLTALARWNMRLNPYGLSLFAIVRTQSASAPS